MFGPQKGASKDDVATLDASLAHFAQVIDSQLGVAVNDVPGAGAAGGIGAALKGFLNAEFRPGIAIVIEQSGLDAAAQWADVVFTGEGSIDFQTKFGKTLGDYTSTVITEETKKRMQYQLKRIQDGSFAKAPSPSVPTTA